MHEWPKPEKIVEFEEPWYALPSTAIRAAVHDLEICEKSERYEIDMDYWHEPRVETVGCETDGDLREREFCKVCFAGSVMANRLGGDPSKTIFPREFSSERVKRVLLGLNYIRDYDVESYLSYFKHYCDKEIHDRICNIDMEGFKEDCLERLYDEDSGMYDTYSYEDDPEKFKISMLIISDYLEENWL